MILILFNQSHAQRLYKPIRIQDSDSNPRTIYIDIMKYNHAYTAPTNPPSASPVLTHEQVWKGLVKKCRRPQDFVAAMSNCEILEESEGGLKRVVTFKPGMGPPAGKVMEIITYHGNTTVRISQFFLLTGGEGESLYSGCLNGAGRLQNDRCR